jgi:anthranilate phosphoribosyltransferase
MLKRFIQKLADRQDLTIDEMKEAMDAITSGQAGDAQISAFITALRMKGETVDEITAAAMVMRDKAHRIQIDRTPLLDTCGTGGDGANLYNISTAVAIVAAAAGVSVAKHGNRALTSKSGSADVLKALGVNIELTKEKITACVEKVGLAFLFAPGCHMAMKYAMPVRKEIGIRTIFNILGPIINPARNTHHMMGVYSTELTEKVAGVLKKMGNVHSLVVCGEGNIDEAILWGYTKISELKNGEITTYRIKPEDYGIKPAPMSEVTGGGPEENARLILDIFEGKRKDAYYEILVFNAGIAIYTADNAAGIKEGIDRARKIIDAGDALEKLKDFVECTQSIGA